MIHGLVIPERPEPLELLEAADIMHQRGRPAQERHIRSLGPGYVRRQGMHPQGVITLEQHMGAALSQPVSILPGQIRQTPRQPGHETGRNQHP